MKHKHENHDEHHHDTPVEDSEIREWKRRLIWLFSSGILLGIIRKI